MMSWLAEHEGAVGGERELRAAGGAGSGSAPSACSHRPGTGTILHGRQAEPTQPRGARGKAERAASFGQRL